MDFASLLELSRKQEWALVAMDIGVDTSTAAGQLVANVMASVAEWERRVIGERTAAALRMKREQGVVLGRPREMSEETIERIAELYQSGLTIAAIARTLNEQGVSSPRGERWHSPGVKRALSWGGSSVRYAEGSDEVVAAKCGRGAGMMPTCQRLARRGS